MTKVTLKYITNCGHKWDEKYATLEAAAIGAREMLGRWAGNYRYLVGEFGDCKLYHVDGATLKDLEDAMIAAKEVANG